jgi:hypothetical protein
MLAEPSPRFVGLAAINPLIGPAEGAEVSLNGPDEQVNRASLFFSGMTADRAVDAGFGHGTVFRCDISFHHNTIFTDGSFRSAS